MADNTFDPSQDPNMTPTQNPLGLTYDQTTALRDSGHISQPLYDRIYPGQGQPQAPAPAPVAPVVPTDPDDYKAASRAIFNAHKEGVANMEDASAQRAAEAPAKAEAARQADIAQKTATAKKMGMSDEEIKKGLAESGFTPVSATPGQPGDVRTADIKPGDKPQISLAADRMDQQTIKGDQPTMDDYFKMYGPNMSGYDAMQKAAKDSAIAGKAKASEDSAYLEKSAKDQQRILDQQVSDQAYAKSQLDMQNDKMQMAADNFSSMKVDPNRVWKDKTTGDKVTAGIAMILGAFGSGGNKAVQVLDNIVERDINAQKADIATAKDTYNAQSGVYGHMLSQFKNTEAATEATRVATLQRVQTQVQATAARYGGADAKAKSEMLIGEIQQKINEAKANFNLQIRAAMPVNPDALPGQVPASMEDKFVHGYGVAYNKDLAKDMNEAVPKAKLVRDSIGELQKIIETPFKSLDPSARATALAHVTSLIGPLKDAMFGAGAKLNETEIHMIDDLVGNPANVFSMDTKSKAIFQTLLDKVNASINYKAYQAGLTTPEERQAKQLKLGKR